MNINEEKLLAVLIKILEEMKRRNELKEYELGLKKNIEVEL